MSTQGDPVEASSGLPQEAQLAHQNCREKVLAIRALAQCQPPERHIHPQQAILVTEGLLL